MSSNSGIVDLDAATKETSDEAPTVSLDSDTVATPHHLTLYYVPETPKQFSDKFPQEKLHKHAGETVIIERSISADILLNAEDMPRSFVELWCLSERGYGPKWFLKKKNRTKKVEICEGRMSSSLNQDQKAEIKHGCKIKLENLTFFVGIEDGDTLTGDFEVDVLPQDQMMFSSNGFNRQISHSSGSGNSNSSGSSGSGVPFPGMPNMFTLPAVSPEIAALANLFSPHLPPVIQRQPQYRWDHQFYCQSNNTCTSCAPCHAHRQANYPPTAICVHQVGACGAGAVGANVSGHAPAAGASRTPGSETAPHSAAQPAFDRNHLPPSLPPGIPACDQTLPVSILHHIGGGTAATEHGPQAAHANVVFSNPQYFEQQHQPPYHGNRVYPSFQSQVVGPLHGPLSMPVNNSYSNSVNNFPVLPQSSIHPSQHLQRAPQQQWQSSVVGAATPSLQPLAIPSAQPVQVASSSVDSLSGIHNISPRQAVSEGLAEVSTTAGYHQIMAEIVNGLSSRVVLAEENRQQVLPNDGGGHAVVDLTAQQMQHRPVQQNGGGPVPQTQVGASGTVRMPYPVDSQSGQGPRGFYSSAGATPTSLNSSDLHAQRTETEISNSLLAAANGNVVNLRAGAGLHAGQAESLNFTSARSENVLDLRSNGEHSGREPQEDDERQPEEHDDHQRPQ